MVYFVMKGITNDEATMLLKDVIRTLQGMGIHLQGVPTTLYKDFKPWYRGAYAFIAWQGKPERTLFNQTLPRREPATLF